MTIGSNNSNEEKSELPEIRQDYRLAPIQTQLLGQDVQRLDSYLNSHHLPQFRSPTADISPFTYQGFSYQIPVNPNEILPPRPPTLATKRSFNVSNFDLEWSFNFV
jgi:hypothetical protein